MAAITDWIGAEAARGPATPDVGWKVGYRYTITGARVLHRPDIVFTVTGTVEKLTHGATKAKIRTDHGVVADVDAHTITTIEAA